MGLSIASNGKKNHGVSRSYRTLSLVILTDTREQKPIFHGHRINLLVGDYTTWKLRNRFHIERKSPGDLYGTLLGGHNRFRREILRAAEHKIKLVVYVECSAKEFYAKDWPGGKYCKFPSVSIERCIKTMTVKYDLEFNFCRSRNHMTKQIIERLTLEEKKL